MAVSVADILCGRELSCVRGDAGMRVAGMGGNVGLMLEEFVGVGLDF